MAYYHLEAMYKHGTGFPLDHTEPVRWYRLAADQDHTRGQCILGVMYRDGTGVPQDFNEAARLIKLAVDHGWKPGARATHGSPAAAPGSPGWKPLSPCHVRFRSPCS